MDSGVSHHLTSEKGNLTNLIAYSGNEIVMLDNGHIVLITSYSNGLLYSSSLNLKLQNLLHVSHLAKNLVSIRQLCVDNNMSI